MVLPPLSPADYQAIALSVKVATAATILSLPFGYAVACLLTYIEFRGKLLLEVLVNLPLTLPPVVVGYLLLVMFGTHGWLGVWLNQHGIRIIFTAKASVVASAVVGFPLLVRSLRTSLEGIDRQLIHAARTLGATWFGTLISVILPLSLTGLLAGSSLMFARSLGEFGATIIVAGNIPGVTQTIPLAIYEYACSPASEQMALSLCLVSLTISVAVMYLHERFARKAARRNGA